MNSKLIYVVGPSGAGKDSLLTWLKAQLPASASVHWSQRTIDRAQAVSRHSEQHESVTTVEFDQLAVEGQFALHWSANGHCYGVRRREVESLSPGQWVMVNGSREHLVQASRDFPGLTVLHITAARDVLRARLFQRGRESQEAIEARLNRNVPLVVPEHSRLVEIWNDDPLAVTGQRLLRALEGIGFPQT